MTQGNRFRHQTYTSERPESPHHQLSPVAPPPVDSDEFRRRMQQVGSVLREAGVEAVYLVHGTFVGSDAMGVLAELARLFPKASKSVRNVIKRVVDQLTGEAGNYTPSYARCFENAMHRPGEPRIPVRLFYWSSENHHIGRADGAVRLIHELSTLERDAGSRVLLWGHSHAGNVFALLTNLLGGDREAVEEFFEATEIYYRWPLFRCVDIPVWERVRDLLHRDRPPLGDLDLDMVTFGTPVRYGWESSGYSHLMHFINHRPVDGMPDYRAEFPPKLDDVLKGRAGDFIQQLGIAGTNVMPSMFAWRAWMADQRLNELLQAEAVPGSRREWFEAGRIVPDEGVTLLVDYGKSEGGIADRVVGHAIYTRKRWLLFHAEEIARRFYGAEMREVA